MTEEDPCHPNKLFTYTSHIQEFHHLHKHIHIYTLHFIHAIHISTRTCNIHHKRGVTEVCHFGHFWLSYGRCAMSGSLLGMLLGLSWQQADQATCSNNLPSSMFLGVYSCSNMIGTPSGRLVGLSRRNQTMLHMALYVMCDWVAHDG